MLLTLITMIGMIVLMISLNALYVAGEFAAVSARKSRITQFASEGNSLAKMLLPVLENTHRLDNYIAASQVGITLSSIVLGIYGQQQIAPHLEPLFSEIPAVGTAAAAGVASTFILILLTTLQVVLGELVPKSLALRYPERVAMSTAVPMRWSADIILKPLIVFLNGSGNLLMRLMGIHHSEGHKHVHSPEEIKYLLMQSHEGGLLDDQEHLLLDSAFRFRKLKAGEITIPRTRMTAAEVNTPVDELLRLAAQADYTRIPIYENDIDHIIGFIHLKELFQLSYSGQGEGVRSILRDVSFVHEAAHLDDVWNTLNREQSYLAIVSDEYGGTAGLITREDLLEELFGDVQDEFDASEANPLRKIGENRYLVHGEMSITHLNDRLNLSLQTDDAYTIGGFFLNQLGKVPRKGDEITLGNLRFTVHAVKDRAVQELLLNIEKPQPTEDAAQ